MLSITDLTYRIAGRSLFDAASAQIPEGHRVGLIGRNGAGKSTLLSLILGELQPDGGAIDLPRESRIGVVAQEAPGGDQTPIDVVLAADAERAALLDEAEHATDPDRIGHIYARLADIDAHSAPARAAGILAGLGFDEEMQNRPMSSYSGGWRMRVALAAVLFSEPDLLLLDEPTNHLDLEATVWLDTYLRSYPRTMLLVSHDRHILNSAVDHILHLDESKLVYYSGGYDEFERLRAIKVAQSRAMAAKLDARRQHMQAYVDRFRYKASKARQAQSRLKAIERLETITVMNEEGDVRFDFPDPPELSPPLVSLEGVSVGYTPGKPVLKGLSLRLDPEDRIALLGANGNGKSTFAKLLAGRLAPMTGHQHRAPKLTCGFFAQHQIEDMDPTGTPFSHLADLMKGVNDLGVRSRLGRFGFPGDKAFVKVGELSGGERARLNFALVTYSAPSILILDEPTNHLDIPSREALARSINDYSGTVVLISHDWHLLELTADRLWLVADGKVTPFDGDLEDYRTLMLGGRRGNGGGGSGKSSEKPRGAEKRKTLDPLRRSARDAEATLTKLAGQREAVDAKLAKPGLTSGERADAMRRRAEIMRALEAAEAEWLQAEEALAAATA